MFFFTTVDSEEEEEKELERRDTSISIEDRIDELEEALEREMRADKITSHFMHCLGGILKILIRWYIWLKNKDHQDCMREWQTLMKKTPLKSCVSIWI